MKRAIVAALLLLCGCETDNIIACSTSCERGGNAMLAYSKTDGCKCGGALVKP